MDWQEWRHNGLGASDSPIIMGVSPWKTRFQLWEEKTGPLLKESYNKGNWATDRGNRLEPKARAHYELLNNIDMPAVLVENDDYPFIRASLDGYNEAASRILEIKCPGKDDHELAKNGQVPEKYYPQLQHQLLVTGANEAHYYSFDGESGHLVIVKPDAAYIKKLFKELVAFWELVITKTPPELSDKDFKKVRDKELQQAIDEWQAVTLEVEEKQKLIAELREQIVAKLTHQNMVHKGVKIYKSYRKGNVDYSKIPVLKGLNLEEYRKPGTSYYTFKASSKQSTDE